MKKFLPLFWLFLVGCYPVAPEPADPLTQTAWCNGNTTYRFETDGGFTMKDGKLGQTWGGNWSYLEGRSDVEINLRYGPNRLIQIIRLRSVQCTATKLTALWSDEQIRDVSMEGQACDG